MLLLSGSGHLQSRSTNRESHWLQSSVLNNRGSQRVLPSWLYWSPSPATFERTCESKEQFTNKYISLVKNILLLQIGVAKWHAETRYAIVEGSKLTLTWVSFFKLHQKQFTGFSHSDDWNKATSAANRTPDLKYSSREPLPQIKNIRVTFQWYFTLPRFQRSCFPAPSGNS